MLLDPRMSMEDECHRLKLNVFGTQPNKYFTCGCCWDPSCYMNQCNENYICIICGRLAEEQIKVEPVPRTKKSCEVFAQQHTSFLISDDLRMSLNESSFLQNVTDLGIMDIDGAEYKIVSVGYNEIMDLLKGSLFSKTPLTDLFLRKGHTGPTVMAEPQLKTILPQMVKQEICSSKKNKKMKIKATVQLSQNKFLYAQSEEDFVDFLFSLLTFPLGQVKRLLKMVSPLGCIDNLYSSVESLKGIQRIENLLNPRLPPRYLSRHQILSLAEQTAPRLYYHEKTDDGEAYLSNRFSKSPNDSVVYILDPKGCGAYVQRGTTFMITDDLTVTPLCVLSNLSALKELKIPLSDIVEIEVEIGIEEALNILKASLTSPSTLTSGLKLDSALWKQPKEEH